MKKYTIISINGLQKNYEGFNLKDISFSVKSGECICLLGKNGSGKSTILNLLMKLTKFDKGEILFKDRNILNDNTYKNDVVYIGDSSEFFPNLKLKDLKNIYKIFYNRWDEQNYKKLMNLFYLDENKKLMELSSGMKIKFMVNVALSSNPKLIILDESLSCLDIYSKTNILQILKNYVKSTESCLLYTTHSLDEIKNIADRLVILNNGKIIKITDCNNFSVDDYKKWI